MRKCNIGGKWINKLDFSTNSVKLAIIYRKVSHLS